MCHDRSMRCVAGAGLLALVACNQVFGIAETRGFDASIDVPPDMPHVVLDWQIASVLATGGPDPVIRFAPIAPAPRVRITPLDLPFAADPADDRDHTSYASDGSIAIPRSYLRTTWRLEYAIAGGVPHEVQWAPDDKQGHLTVPLSGRLARDTAPTGGGYQITPVNPPTSYTFPRVMTTGLWTEGVASVTGTTMDFDYTASAKSWSGPLGRPDPALGDRAVVVDYAIETSCRIAIGAAALDSAAIVPGSHTPAAPVWDTRRKQVTMSPIGLGELGRLGEALGTRSVGLSPSSSLLLFGAVASSDMPGLAAAPESAIQRLGAMLPVPVMQTLLQCPYDLKMPPSSLHMVAQPAVLDPFARVVHVQLVDTRTALGANLSSGLETAIIAPDSQTAFAIAFPAPLALQIALATPANGTVDLAGDSDRVAVGAPSGAFTLSVVPEVGTGLRVDYYEFVLHRIAGGALIPERIYTVTAPQVRIDGAVLSPGADYVFEIRSYKGHPRAQHGDFSAVDYPYGAAIVWSRTFIAM